ncbi:MAG TPA: DUF3551 domain-containing protein [Pseudolabrys sp.]|jgi:hypothetical protein|nr:DUF3551 domain-containing protein [Pseudolabrys sp.]
MKTLTTFAAVAALIAGIGVASAQNSQGTAAAKPAAAGTGKFCLTGKDGPKNCSFMTMAACQTAAKGKKGTCAANPQDATTGSK